MKMLLPHNMFESHPEHILIRFFFFVCFPFTGNAQNYQLAIDFDTSSAGVYIDTSLSSNIWQIGAPQKSYFTSVWRNRS
jgi:hypothetical protein